MSCQVKVATPQIMFSGPVNTKHLYSISTLLDQRRRRWADVVKMLRKCFVFAGGEGLMDYINLLQVGTVQQQIRQLVPDDSSG